jgi:DNA helicase II / ATP-dependent DNA helicase PcrA
MKFTDAQQRAIDYVEGNLQIIACAGSGKTEVVARRVVTLLTSVEKGGGGCVPANIVAFTFTDKAAAELKDRIHVRCRDTFGEIAGLAEMYIGTIHGFCLDLLKSEVPEYMKYEVLNEVQQALFVDRYSRLSGLTQSSTLDGQQLKRFIDTRNYVAALSNPSRGRCDRCLEARAVQRGGEPRAILPGLFWDPEGGSRRPRARRLLGA